MAKYTALSSDDCRERCSASPDSSASPSLPPSSTKPLYVPPYDVNSVFHYASFITDIEDDAPKRPRNRRVDPLPAYDSDRRFKMETPSPITRAALLALLFFLFWLAFNLRKGVWVATGMGMEKEGTEMVDLSD